MTTFRPAIALLAVLASGAFGLTPSGAFGLAPQCPDCSATFPLSFELEGPVGCKVVFHFDGSRGKCQKSLNGCIPTSEGCEFSTTQTCTLSGPNCCQYVGWTGDHVSWDFWPCSTQQHIMDSIECGTGPQPLVFALGFGAGCTGIPTTSLTKWFECHPCP